MLKYFRVASVAFAVEKLHRHERVEEVGDGARMQAEFLPHFRASETALGRAS